MAYKKAAEENRTVLGTYARNKRGDHIQVTAIDDGSGVIQYDIRNMYTNDADELCFTAKGVRIKNDMMIKVIAAILNNMDVDSYNEIMSLIDTSCDCCMELESE